MNQSLYQRKSYQTIWIFVPLGEQANVVGLARIEPAPVPRILARRRTLKHNGPDIAIAQLNSRARGQFYSWLETLEHVLNPRERFIYNRHAREWKPFLDRYQRRVIRMFFFHMIFGYFMGSVLAQQYGVNSAFLDATTSLDVAFFFATHGPRDDYVAGQTDGLGVIYRFPYEYKPISVAQPDDFCSLPPAIDAVRVLEQSAEEDTEPRIMMEGFQRHCKAVYEETTNGRRKWSFPIGCIKTTRVWRQAAVVLVPDELRRDLPGKQEAVGGIVPPAFQYIEDLGFRRGVEAFYFRQDGTSAPVSSLTREHLWPRGDALLPLLVSGMTAVYPVRRFAPHFIPYRLDLIDAGFQKDGFRMICERYAQQHSLMLWSDDLRAVAMGRVIV
jgi:hypothetical protein